tara:strand:- start:285 stop:440 length:156 start_codon:yes stop_codon:yes gene_type:complete
MNYFSKKRIFKLLAKFNKLFAPKIFRKDLAKLKFYEKILIAYRYWVTKNSL